jgi:hypothetical protein
MVALLKEVYWRGPTVFTAEIRRVEAENASRREQREDRNLEARPRRGTGTAQ